MNGSHLRVADLKPNKLNPRKIGNDALEMLGKSMKEFGDLSGIIFNVRTGRLISGHQRIKHLDPSWPIEAGFIKTPFGDFVYKEVDWPEKKEMAAMIAANKHGGEFDYPLLKDFITEIDDGAFDMALTGFKEGELTAIFAWDKIPDQNKPIDEDAMARTENECPSCGFKW